MLTLSSEYALRAMIYLTVHCDEWPIRGRTIADQAEIPRKYLSKILGDLVRVGVLVSSPGIGGGFQMARDPKDIPLQEVLAPFEPILADRRPCPFGNVTCNDDDPCAGHEQWKTVRQAYATFLQKTSIHDVSVKQPRS